MKKTLLFNVLIATLTISTGCNKTNKIFEKDILHHRFILINANNENVLIY